MASHLLNNKLAQKVSFHPCIHSLKQTPVFVCSLDIVCSCFLPLFLYHI